MSNESLFVAAFVYLLAAVVSVSLFKKLGLSSVLGYLVAGILIGPFGLGFVGSEGEDVMHFAEFGVVMMLFLIGLELQPALLWRLRGPILGLGGGQVLITTGVITAIGLAAGLSWQMALAVGMSLALSSTAIVLQSLQEKGQANSSGGRSAFSVLLFQDIAVIPMLAIMPLLATLHISTGGGKDDHGGGHGGGNVVQEWLSHQPGWVNTLLVMVAVVAIIIMGRYLLRPVLRAVAKTGVREAFVALALVLVIGIALLMSSLGVSPALGTFLAGVVLAESEYRHELESDIEPFKGLLLGVFFIAVGASIDFSLIAQKPAHVAAIVLGLVVVKAVILFGLGSVAKLILDQRMLFSLSLAQGSEFAFVLLGFALGAGVLEVGVVQILIASVALTMALTPLIMLFEEKVLRVRLGTKTTGGKEADAMEEDAPVILAGVGRFGNFIARLLMAQKIPVTVIDSDPDHVEFLRRLGIKTFYGDVARHDLLESAGAAKARLLIIAIDSEDQIAELLETVEKHFPNLEVLVRALSREHEFEMIEAEVDGVVHQHVGSAVCLAEQALKKLGYRGHQAARAAKRFMRHDASAAREGAAVRADEKKFIQRIRARMNELENAFEAERQGIEEVDLGWDSERLREDTKSGNYSTIVPKGDGEA
ncbi:MAG: monovalent cation:proton antiporter-2 (CPA2) family protein [Puniceicoccaceae bacterium]